ncbi:MAG: hypothetical protein QM803_15760 [Rhodocyclaceae bacterium]
MLVLIAIAILPRAEKLAERARASLAGVPGLTPLLQRGRLTVSKRFAHVLRFPMEGRMRSGPLQGGIVDVEDLAVSREL